MTGLSFWAFVDSQPAYGSRPNHDGWEAQRDEEWCIAINSRQERCGQQACADSPFCGFHYDRAAEWFWRRLSVERVDALEERRLNLREIALSARERDAESVLKAANAEVYFLGVDDIVKIGFSKNVAMRVAQLRSKGGALMPEGYDPKRAELLGTAPGGRELEARLHGRLSDHRIVGEWFVLSPEVREAIDHFVHGKPAPLWDERLASLSAQRLADTG
jgi:hypothetical protein